MAFKDPQKHKQWMKTWYQRNRTKVKERSRLYELENKPRLKIRRKQYRQRPYVKTAVRIKSLEFYHKNPLYRLRQLERTSQRRIEWRKRIFALLGGERCNKCGFSDYRALQIDHKNGGGRKQFKLNPCLSKPKPYFDHIKQNISDFQVLCCNCNWIKRFEANEVPNKRNYEISRDER